MLPVWEKPLTEEDIEKMIERVADEIGKRGLETPAILFLEMHKPLANVFAHGALAFSPFLMPFLGFERVDRYTQFMASPENVERLIQRIEAQRAARAEAKTNG